MSIALHQAEALQGCIGKAVHLWTHRIVDRPPNSFSSAGTNGKAIGIVNFRPPVLFGPIPLWVEVALTLPEHTGLRRNPDRQSVVKVKGVELRVDYVGCG